MFRPPWLLISCLVSLASPALAQEGPAAEVTPSTVAVVPLAANAAGKDAALGITSLIAGRLAESPRLRVLSQRELQVKVGAGRQQELVGDSPCEKGDCVQALSSLTGARYVLTGRVDRFGGQYLFTASLVDTTDGRTLARPRAEASEDGELLRTVVAVSDELSVALESPGEVVTARPLLGGGAVASSPGGGLTLGLRFNNSFIDKLASLNPGLDLEVGYWFHPEWQGFVQVGFSLVRAGGTEEGKVSVLPSIVGARHYHRLEKTLRPYWGFGLGVQLAFGDYGIFQNTGPLPSVVGFVGLEYLLVGHVAFQMELGTNLAQAVLGLADDGAGDGLNFDVNAGIAYHF
ncbi:hypothetical protein JYK02_35170 [Corallococcus macrosporus]|uniref:Uncharacterized protein n=1 Tax=Corallococcus macrosporus TaxID=35 RepID=A0ABS3DN49_9BACT|nr:hypothetical protein [Corallococcus macrosporus]MBN8232773.1 hypothetical protein [Corallococcus macrosporus]